MARKTKEDTLETYNRLLKAAADVFFEKGVMRATLEDIAEAAGMTRGAVYWHFRNKLDLFSALHEQTHSFFMQQIIESRDTDTARALHQLAELCIQILVDIAANEEQKKAISIFMLKCDYSGEMAPFLQVQNEKKYEAMSVIAGFFQKARTRGMLADDIDCNLLSTSLCCFITGILMEYLRDPTIFDIRKQARPMIELFFRNIEAR